MSKLLGDLPRLFPRPEQTIAGIGRLLRQGEVTCVDILNSCLEQVDEWEPKVHAWVVLDREGAMEQARALDEELRSGKDRGPIHGIPIGIKDIIAVRGLPTACGVPRQGDQIADRDAAVVESLRVAGAVILGKTVTTPYAWIDPPPTRNPWNLDRTPGGSSSGSAAAVACGMCFGAIGTQTGGSITRPASFCGVAGMKPAHGRVNTLGVLPLAPSLDHVGPIARSVEDLQSLYSALVPQATDSAEDGEIRRVSGSGPPRIGRPRGFFDSRSEPIVRPAMEDAVRQLRACGAEIVDLDDPLDFEVILTQHRRVLAAEAAGFHGRNLEANPDRYPPRITELILEGRSVLAWEYIYSREGGLGSYVSVFSAMQDSDVSCLITPATVSTATVPSSTGDPAFNSPWSYMQLPTVSLPVALADDAMPVAIQLVGHPFDGEYDLLTVARWCERAIQSREL